MTTLDEIGTPTRGYVRSSFAREKHPDDPELIRIRQEGFDRWLADHDRKLAAHIAQRVRSNCTPSAEAYRLGGDRLVYEVADWIENPPEWVTTVWQINEA